MRLAIQQRAAVGTEALGGIDTDGQIGDLDPRRDERLDGTIREELAFVTVAASAKARRSSALRRSQAATP